MANQDHIVSMVEEFGKLDATNYSAEDAIAMCVIRKLYGYKIGRHFEMDVDTVKIAIQAYAKLLQDNGVKVS